MARRRDGCRRLHCGAPVVQFGLCERHHHEAEAESRRHDEAVTALHSGMIDGEYLSAGTLRDEFWRARDWWFQVCEAVNSEREHQLLHDETQYAVSWCIAIAAHIIDEARDMRAGKPGGTDAHNYLRRPYWERFENLSRGLMSNGIERPTRKQPSHNGP